MLPDHSSPQGHAAGHSKATGQRAKCCQLRRQEASFPEVWLQGPPFFLGREGRQEGAGGPGVHSQHLATLGNVDSGRLARCPGHCAWWWPCCLQTGAWRQVPSAQAERCGRVDRCFCPGLAFLSRQPRIRGGPTLGVGADNDTGVREVVPRSNAHRGATGEVGCSATGRAEEAQRPPARLWVWRPGRQGN